MCPERPHVRPQPSAAIRKLQLALQGLAKRMHDPPASTHADGLVGPRTVKATNYALYKYARGGIPEKYTTGALTRKQVVAWAPQLASYIQRAPYQEAAVSSIAPVPAVIPAPVTPPQGDTAMPAPGYYPPGYMPPGYAPQPTYYSPPGARRGPGGLPTDEASLDIRAFVPAQYEHVRINPSTVMVAIGIGLVIYLAVSKMKKERS